MRNYYINPLFRWYKTVMKAFKPGTAVVWDPTNFNKEYWDKLPEKDRKRYYAWAGYGSPKTKVFVYLCAILDAKGVDSGHCVLVDLDDGHIEHMRHTVELRAATEDEL